MIGALLNVSTVALPIATVMTWTGSQQHKKDGVYMLLIPIEPKGRMGGVPPEGATSRMLFR